jgi:hypothetical protein
MTHKPLTQAEILFFKTHGYVIKRGILDPALMTQAREALWAGAPTELKRDDPSSWVGPFQEESDDPTSVRQGYTWKYRAPGSDDWMKQLLPQNPQVWAIAEQLLGVGNLQPPERVRGIYCMLPEGDLPERPYRFHIDRHPFHLGVVAYIDRVVPNGGGFTVWPDSHRRFYPLFATQHTFTPHAEAQAAGESAQAQPYVDCHGDAGDVVFWHHRLGHSAGHNRSANIRQAVLYDFKHKDLAQLQELPPHEDMWADWAV